MAGDWIKFETCTCDKPEVCFIASTLDLDPDAVVGKLLRVWIWFDSHSTDGNAPSVTKVLLDRQVGVTGFCNAMVQSGWMVEEQGVVSIPNFTRHNGQTAKKRAQTAKRVAVKRKCNAASVTESGTGALPREEKRREEKSINSLSTVREQSKHWKDSEEFRAAWMAWLSHLGAVRGPVSEPAEQQQLYELARFSVDDATAIVRFSLVKQARNLITNGDHNRQSDASDAKQPIGRRKVPTLEEGVI
jgi:hypothetical protein